MDINSLDRFLQAQERMYPIALKEIKNGEKESHWMWYVFPQLRGLGASRMSYVYGLNGVEEARAYQSHPELYARLVEISEALLEHRETAIEDLIGDLDVIKLHSSMTLFAVLSNDRSVFHKVIDHFFDGEMDKQTIKLITSK